MYNLDNAINDWRRQMAAYGINNAIVLDELEGHLREHIERQIQTGLSEAEAFQIASRELGDGESLKREFAKVRQPQSMLNNPWSLNLVAAWFIIAGFNAISSAGVWRYMEFDWRVFISIVMELVICSQVFIGIGLLRRKEFCRGLAVGWSRCSLLLFAWGQIYIHLISSQQTSAHGSSLGIAVIGMSAHQTLQYQFLGMPLPVVFCTIISMLNVAMLIWAYYLFTRTRVQELFQRAN